MMLVGTLHCYVKEQCRGRRVLYIGAGDDLGGVAPSAIETAAVSSFWHGVDINPSLPSKSGLLAISVVDLNKPFDLPGLSVDLVVMTEVIEHLLCPSLTLRELGRNFPGVEFLGSVPNALSYGRLLLSFFADRAYRMQDEKHTALYNPTVLSNLLTTVGMQNVRLIPYQERLFLRFLTRLRSNFASGFVIHGKLPFSAIGGP